MRKSRLRYITIVAMTALSLSACGGKDTPDETTVAVEETQDPFAINGSEGIAVIPVDKETEDSSAIETTVEAEVVEITETQANGLAAGKLSNGDGFVEINEPGALESKESIESAEPEATEEAETTAQSEPEQMQEAQEETATETQPETAQEAQAVKEMAASAKGVMSEEELVSYDVVVTFWCEHPDMSEQYLEEMLGSEKRFPSLSEEQRGALIQEVKDTYPHNPEETKAYETYWD